ncbi:MAG: MFS transporter [Rhodobacteraceae bacterium]|nr:MFS transporter [Paracoccaceae bacterium]
MEVSKTVLGGALIGSALGVQISLMFAGPLLKRLGFQKTLFLGIPMLGVAEAAASMMHTPIAFFVLLAIGGLAIGAVEILVNLEADRTEHLVGRRIMNRAHAMWSFGFFTTGLIGAGAAQFGIHPAAQLLAITVLCSLATFWLFAGFKPAPARPHDSDSSSEFVWPTKGILLIVAFCLSAMLLEGASADWSVIFMRDVFHTTPFLSGLALAFGALSQGILRFFADGLIDRFGTTLVARVLVATLGVGVVTVTFATNPAMALIGFALMGFGTSAIFPLAMSAAAQRTDRPAAANVASLAQVAFTTFLLAPPLLGFIAEYFGIRVSFGLGIPLVILSWFTISSLQPPQK